MTSDSLILPAVTRASGTIDFFCLGAQKCGTSALTMLLGEHPELAVPPYAPGAFGLPHGWDTPWLLANAFAAAAADARLGIVNPRFMIGHGVTTVDTVAERLHREAPEARLLVIVRDPIDRAVSTWRMAHRRERVTESFDEFALLSLRGETRPGVVRHGCYGSVLAPYVARFPLERFLIIDNGDLGTRGRETLARVFAHLGVDPGFVPPGIDQRVHASGSRQRMTSDSAEAIIRYLKKHWFAHLEEPERFERAAAFRFWFDRFNVIPDDDLPEMSDEVRDRLIDVYLADAELLEQRMGWLAPWVRRDQDRLVWAGR